MEVRASVFSSYKDTNRISGVSLSCPNLSLITSQKLRFNLIWWLLSVVPVLKRPRQEDCSRSWASLVYIVSVSLVIQ